MHSYELLKFAIQHLFPKTYPSRSVSSEPAMPDFTDAEAERMLIIVGNACRMLAARDYHVLGGWDEVSDISTLRSLIEAHTSDGSRMGIDAVGVGTGEKLRVYFPQDEKFNIKVLRFFCENMHEKGIRRGIFLLPGKITPRTRQALAEVAPTFLLEVFFQWEMLVDITKHYLVPEHKVLTEEEKQAMLKRCKVKDTQLPRMLPDDPISRYFALRPGQVVKIFRKSPNAGRYVTYRICL
jgi:DNA-directed RNA polymerase I, II, and III subunit RPABC1